MKYYISDLHFDHRNILSFDQRPFDSIEQMNNVLIENWNNKVGDNDDVYILGDFCFGNLERWKFFLLELKGRKHLIVGNHDSKRINNLDIYKLFNSIDYYLELQDNGRTVILSHYPILFYNHSYSSNTFMLYGHVHNRTEEAKYTKKFIEILKEKSKLNCANLFNVGCMIQGIDYTPRTLDEIIEIYKRSDNF